MEILLASPRGFCAGVARAIEIVELALERHGPPVYVRHEIVHNRHVVENLRERGAVFIEDPEEAPKDSLLIFSAHGVSPEIRERADARALRVIDATCPLVTKVHLETLRIAKRGQEIVLVGHAGHVEVEGTRGHAPELVHLVENVEDVARLEVRNPDELGCVTQTTLSVDDTREILAALQRRFPKIALPRKDDICYATQNRQNAVKQLAERAQLVLVVGAPTSSNSQRLVEVAERCGVRGRRVEEASQIDPAWLEGIDCVGVTAGASAPEALVDDVVERVGALAGSANLVEFEPVDEGMHFQLPAELR